MSEEVRRENLRRRIPIAALITFMFLLSAWAWNRVPVRIPVHFDFHGHVDRYGGRPEGLLVMPLASLGLWGLFEVLPRIDPARRGYRAFAGAWTLLQVSLFAFLAFVHVSLIARALGIDLDVTRAMTLGTALLCVVIGSVLGRLKRNWFAGVRTPWTLSSERSWQQTHRLAGRMFVAVGLLAMPVGLLSGPWGLGVLLGGLGIATVVSVVYSWVVWRGDPDRAPRA